MTGHALEILLVEANPGDARLIREAMQESKVANHLTHLPEGVATLDFLHRRAPYQNAPRPDLILLDLNLPRQDGREVLAAIKQDPNLRRIPVVVLNTSQAEQEILHAYDLSANCYVAKPGDLDQFLKVIRVIESFWLTIVKLPTE